MPIARLDRRPEWISSIQSRRLGHFSSGLSREECACSLDMRRDQYILAKIFFLSLSQFALQFNLPVILGVMHPSWGLIRLSSYFFLGGALAPCLIWILQRRGWTDIILWLPPIVLSLGVGLALSDPSIFECAIFLLFVFVPINASLLLLIFKRPFRQTYLYDLIGGLAGFVIAVFCLPVLSGEGVYFFALICATIPLLLSVRDPWARFASFTFTLAAVLLFIAQVKWRSFDSIRIPRPQRSTDLLASTILQKSPEARLIDTEWSTISRVDAIEFKGKLGLFYNNRLWSPVGQWGGVTRFDAAKPFWKGVESALVIGTGGGNDVRELARENVLNITALEVNPATVAVNLRLEKESGGPYRDLPVKLIEGRAFLETTDQSYDLIWLNTADLFAPQTRSGLELESFLYTREAIEEYWSHLTEQGVLIIEFNLLESFFHSMTSIRLANTLLDFFRSSGRDIAKHLFVFSHRLGSFESRPRRVVFVLKKKELDSTDIAYFKDAIAKYPGMQWLTGSEISSGASPVERCLQNLLKGDGRICGFDSTLVNRDNYPFYNVGPKLLPFLGYSFFIPLLASLALAALYFVRAGENLLGQGVSLACGVTYGFLFPIFYYSFLLYSPSPLTVVALVQTGMLVASIIASRSFESVKGRWTTIVFLTWALLLGFTLYFLRTPIFESLKPGPNTYRAIIFGVVVLMTYPVSLVFQRSLNLRRESHSQLTFGINLTGLCLGSLLSFLVNIFIGLDASFAVLALFILSLIYAELLKLKSRT